jgi:hypothetical protein
MARHSLTHYGMGTSSASSVLSRHARLSRCTEDIQHSFSEGLNDGWAGREASFPDSGDYMRGWRKGHIGLEQAHLREQQLN